MAVRRAPVAPGLHASVMRLHSEAGNRAVTGLLAVQRDTGWKGPDVSQEGKKWNTKEQAVGKIRRIPIQGLSEGLTVDAKIKTLSPEVAKGRAIVLVPDALDASQDFEVMVFLHGFTEDASTRPFAGWRALAKQPKVDKSKLSDDDRAQVELLERLRQGIDEDDTAPVRDVALDQAEAQLEESGQTQLVMVLPQGGLTSQFAGKGEQTFDAPKYVDDVMNQLATEKAMKDSSKKDVEKPKRGRISMAGHSGAGATLADMAELSVTQDKAKKAAEKAGKEFKPEEGANSTITGDLVLFDAMNGPNELKHFQHYAEMRLNNDLAELKAKNTDKEKLDYLKTAQKLRVVSHGGKYKERAVLLEGTVSKWFRDNGGELGAFAGGLRANYTFQVIPGEHEELLRGTRADKQRAKGAGGIVEAITALHTEFKSVADLPPLPASDQPKAPAGAKK